MIGLVCEHRDEAPGRVESVHARTRPAPAAGTVIRRGSRQIPICRVPNAVSPTRRTVDGRRFRRVGGHVRHADRVADRPDRASHRHLRIVPLTDVAAHADDGQHGNLVGHEQRRQGVQGIAEAARLQHHGWPGAAEVHAGGDAERLLFAGGDGCPDIGVGRPEDPQDVRQRVVGDVDDVPAAGGVQPLAHGSRPQGLE